MAGASLLTLIDDIATLLDDVSVMTKVAAKKTSGLLGDDLALNAQQVTGFPADRELPVVWSVAKGSALNKLILVPAALLISAILPQAITPLLMLGGAYLCFEGFEKVFHKLLHSNKRDEADALENVAKTEPVSEKERIRGAIRTDFILSAEIIVITLGTVSTEAFSRQLGVLVIISTLMTVGVYGLVAGIVKMDDAGLALTRAEGDGGGAKVKRTLGAGILRGAPIFMKLLGIFGTIAMFLVGGAIIAHGIHAIYEPLKHAAEGIDEAYGGFVGTLAQMGMEGVVGIIAGGILVALFTIVQRLRGAPAH